MTKQIRTNVLGYPRIGAKRELKKVIEDFWKGTYSQDELLKVARDLRIENWKIQKKEGITLIPSNDFSLYDQMLDMSCLLGAIPSRFDWDGSEIDLDLYFRLARGKSKTDGSDQSNVLPCEMTKWFDTNYHYIVPELTEDTDFRISSSKVFSEFKEACDLNIMTKPVLIGPVTYLLLSKNPDKENFNPLELLHKLIPVYCEIVKRLEDAGAEWIQLDEPIFSTDINEDALKALQISYDTISKAISTAQLIVANYFGGLGEHLSTFTNLPVQALHIDAVRAPSEAALVCDAICNDKLLSVGIVNGRNIWKNNFEDSLNTLRVLLSKVGKKRLLVATSCSLLHSPAALASETEMEDEIKNWLSFSEEKIKEVVVLAKALTGNESVSDELKQNKEAMQLRQSSSLINKEDVKNRCNTVKPENYNRTLPYQERKVIQKARFNLPELPATTIGSFPQTIEIRKKRADFKKNVISRSEYEEFLKNEIKETISKQEILDLDVLVHGEAERNDMVEYFGEQLDGFVFTKFGWVQSYGTRCVKPPIIYGDISRQVPITLEWICYAQSLTERPVKGMLTGPITILQWSFVRDDQPRSETAKQIALALRDEVQDLEKSGIGIIQIDEPALREGLPLKKADWAEYLRWAVDCFRLCANGVKNETQIHTHMCYCEFNDIMDSIAALDADVISMEAARSKMELLRAFSDSKYPNDIGPGVYDIHSPRVPSVDEMVQLLEKALTVIPREYLWVNPDCGLKTRKWEETIESLGNMVKAAKTLRNT